MKHPYIRASLACVAVLVLSLPSAQAGETVDLGDGLKFDWSLGTTYALGVRTKNPNPLLASDASNFTGNDGNNILDGRGGNDTPAALRLGHQ